MRVLVCGGRDYYEYKIVEKVLARLPISTIIEGGASGADTMAYNYATNKGIECLTFKAEWDKYKPAKGKNPAGAIRNTKMLVEGKPDLVIAFPGGLGTANMIRQSKDAGVNTMVIKGSYPTITVELYKVNNKES